VEKILAPGFSHLQKNSHFGCPKTHDAMLSSKIHFINKNQHPGSVWVDLYHHPYQEGPPHVQQRPAASLDPKRRLKVCKRLSIHVRHLSMPLSCLPQSSQTSRACPEPPRQEFKCKAMSLESTMWPQSRKCNPRSQAGDQSKVMTPSNPAFTGGKQQWHRHQQDQHRRWQQGRWQHQ